MFKLSLPKLPSLMMVKLMLYRNAHIILPVIFMLGSILFFYFTNKENFVTVEGKEFVFVSMPGCKYCEKTKPEWELFKKNYGGNQFAMLKDFSTETRSDLVDKYGVASFPSFLYLKNGKLIKMFEGSKSYQEMQKIFDYVVSDH